MLSSTARAAALAVATTPLLLLMSSTAAYGQAVAGRVIDQERDVVVADASVALVGSDGRVLRTGVS